MAWPTKSHMRGPLCAQAGAELGCQQKDSLAGQQSMLSTALHMVAASRARPGHVQPAADPLAPPIAAEKSALSVYVDKRQVAADPLLPVHSDSGYQMPSACSDTARLHVPTSELAIQQVGGLDSATTVKRSAASAGADVGASQAGSERLSFEVIEYEEEVQESSKVACGSSGAAVDGQGVHDGCSLDRVQITHIGGSGCCVRGSRGDSGGGVIRHGSERATVRGAAGDTLLMRHEHRERSPGSCCSSEADGRTSCAPQQCSGSVAVGHEDGAWTPRSPGGSAQVSAARAGARVDVAGRELRPGAPGWPNVRTMAAKVRQRVDSETADVVRKCVAGAQPRRTRRLATGGWCMRGVLMRAPACSRAQQNRVATD